MKHLMINQALPIAELSRLGLYDGHRHLLSDEDLSALLSGRRTAMVNLRDLVSEAFVIDSLDAKLSLHLDEDNFQEIKLHPIYREPQLVPDLSLEDTGLMIRGELQNLAKTIKFPDGVERLMVFEYDSETKEFISYDPSKVKVPSKINGEILDEKLQKDFACGRTVKLSDGTELRYRVTEPKGIAANRSALVISDDDNGQSTGFLIQGISPLTKAGIQYSPFTTGFEKAFVELQKSEGQSADEQVVQRDLEELKRGYSREYGHGLSR